MRSFGEEEIPQPEERAGGQLRREQRDEPLRDVDVHRVEEIRLLHLPEGRVRRGQSRRHDLIDDCDVDIDHDHRVGVVADAEGLLDVLEHPEGVGGAEEGEQAGGYGVEALAVAAGWVRRAVVQAGRTEHTL